MKYIFIILFSLLSYSGFSQGLFALTYDISVPLGETSDYTGKTSFRGFGMEGKSFISNNVALGGSFAWQTFYESEGVQTITEGTTTVTGTPYKYINSFPFLVTGNYFLNNEDEVRAYFGGGLGMYHIIQRTDMGLYSVEDKNWHFGLAPEVGIIVPVGYSTSYFLVNLKYNYAFKANDSVNHSYLGINVGFAFGS